MLRSLFLAAMIVGFSLPGQAKEDDVEVRCGVKSALIKTMVDFRMVRIMTLYHDEYGEVEVWGSYDSGIWQIMTGSGPGRACLLLAGASFSIEAFLLPDGT